MRITPIAPRPWVSLVTAGRLLDSEGVHGPLQNVDDGADVSAGKGGWVDVAKYCAKFSGIGRCCWAAGCLAGGGDDVHLDSFG